MRAMILYHKQPDFLTNDVAALDESSGPVERTLAALEAKLDETGQGAERQELVEQLLSQTRSCSDGDLAPLCTRRGLQVLGRLGFESSHDPAALRCLNNILVRSVPMRQVFVDEGYPEKVLALVKIDEPSIELATANLLLFCVVQTGLDLTPSFEHDDLAGIIHRNVSRHAQSPDSPSADPSAPSNATLRLLSTLAVRYEPQAYRFLETMEPILSMLDKVPSTTSHLSLPASTLIGCLASFPFDRIQTFPVTSVNRLVDILRIAIPASDRPELEKELLPLLLVIFRLAQCKSVAARSRLAHHILPSDDDRVQPLGQGDSLPHKLLKLTSTTVEPELKEMVYTLFFELSDKDPSKFVHNVGFGNAAGFLASKGIDISPKELTKAQGDGTSADINPITGQQRTAEPNPDLPPMSQEEKEREAERLFVLFERLRANGVISAENPVAQFQQSGRFEELPDDEKDA